MKSTLQQYLKSQTEVTDMFNTVAKKYVLMNSLASFGVDKLWRNAIAKYWGLYQHTIWLDIATGHGDVIYHILKKHNTTQTNNLQEIWGIDHAEAMLAFAKKKQIALPHVAWHWQTEDATNMPNIPSNYFDMVTLSFGWRNMPNRERAIQEIHRSLKNQGICILLDFFPMKSGLFASVFKLLFYVHSLWFMPLLAKIVGTDPKAYSYLYHSMQTMPHYNTMLDMWQNNKLSVLAHEHFLCHGVQLWVVQKNI
jgi:demethylmenaquinone methyltransferase / 2-methoxy-6-polyprenyl-1,4-benzoquinol methylase